MDILTLLLIAIGLSMDAFAVSVSNGIFMKTISPAPALKVAGAFGLFQGLMPIIGYAVASVFANTIIAFDHWVAFGLLVFIGGKMLWEVLHETEDETPKGDPTHWRTLLVMAVATSIDAMAVGVTMALGRTGLLAPSWGFLMCSAVIAVITFVFCLCGVYLGCRTGNCFGKRAQIAGGIVLIGIGIKILLEHLLG
ncbi:MAG: manganese efflux pump [Clostridia bacterium]|jgi:putative Mn2+ efflux pump MntP|nr:manganese efflux pump [Clostridia bacterium]